jgi:hypothetical protein
MSINGPEPHIAGSLTSSAELEQIFAESFIFLHRKEEK